MSDDQVTSPEDCLNHCRRSLTKQEYLLAIETIKLYGLNKLLNFLKGKWIDGEATKRKLNDVGRIAMIMDEGLGFLRAWLDRESAMPERASMIGMMIAERARRQYKVPLELALGHLIAEADEETIAMALTAGRSLREEQREERRSSLRLVHSSTGVKE